MTSRQRIGLGTQMSASEMPVNLFTERLLLRRWRDDDRGPFARMNADPQVMRWFPSTLDEAQSDALVDRQIEHHDEHDWGLWAVEVIASERFIGFVGLARDEMSPWVGPSVEIGWRLAHEAWGRGYATEAARRALAYAFSTLGLDEVVSFTSRGNVASRRVMQRLGLRRDPTRDFDHPRLALDHELSPHVFYVIDRRAHAMQPPSDADG